VLIATRLADILQLRTQLLLRLLLVLILASLLLPEMRGLEAQSAITLVQHASKDAGTTTASTLALPSGNTGGNWIAVAIRAGQTDQFFTVTDTRGNTYRRAVQRNDTSDGTTLGLYYAENIAAGPNTITVADSIGGGTLRFAVSEYAGVALTNSLDVTASAQGANATPNSGAVVTTSAGELVIGVVATANPRSLSAGSGYVIADALPASPDTKLLTEYQRQGTAGSVAATAMLNTSDTWAALVAAFRPAASGGSSGPSIANMNPTSGAIGTSVTMSGAGFGATQGTSSVQFGGKTASPTAWSANSITAPVPVGATTGNAVVTVGGISSHGFPFTVTANPTDTHPPTAPGSLTAIATGESQINLNWVASTDDTAVMAYHVEQCAGAGCSNFTEIGTVNAGPGVGPLSASANPNYFKDASGTPIILNGSHTWNSLQDWGSNGSLQTLDFPAFVNFLVAHGHNFTFLWRTELPKFCGLPTTASSPADFAVGPHPWQRTGPGNATDGGRRFDLTKFDQGYFDRLRARAQALNAAGIYAGVYLFNGEWLNVYRCASDGYPFTGANNINGISDGYTSGGTGTGSMTMTSPNPITTLQDAYVEKVIDTLNDLPNVLWLVSEEAPSNSRWWNDHQITHIQSYEAGLPSRHPVGYGTLTDFDDSVITNSNADWINPASFLSPTTSCGTGTPRCKVNINDSDHSYFGMWNSSAQQNRLYAWENFMTGNQVMFMDPYVVYYPREGRNICVATNGICADPDPRWDNFRDNLGYILKYSRKLNLANVLPRGALSSTSNCLAQTPSVGAEYLVYAPYGGSFTVNLSAMSSSRSLTVEWFNPSTGVTTTGGSIPAGSSSRSFTPPFSGDAVLYLVDSAGHAASGTPPPATSFTVTGLAPGAYGYRVRAADAAANLGPYSNVATATIQAADTQAPTAPTGLVATAGSARQIDLSWSASTDNVAVTGYVIARCQGAGCSTFTQVATPPGTATTFTDTGLTAATSYTYQVRATDAANNQSAYSAPASATTIAGTAGITLVQHTSKDAGTTASSSLAFTTNNIAGNWIGVAIRAGQTGQTFTVADTRGNTYRNAVQLNETVDGTTLALYYAENIAGGSNTVTVSDTIAGGTLRFAILEYSGVAVANSLDGTASAQGSGTTPSSGTTTTTASGDLVIGLISAANGVTFTAGNGYAIQDRLPASPNTKLVTEDQRQAAAGPVTAGATLNAADSWGAVVSAFRAGGGGTTDTVPPSAPGMLTATAVSGTRIDLQWGAATDNVGVTGYRVEQCPGAGCTNFVKMATVTGTTYSDTALTPNTTYRYVVRATDAATLLGPYSNIVTATSLATTPELIAAYAFNEGAGTTVGDASGNGNTGTIANATWTTAGKYGSALVFNGTNARVSISDSASLHLTTGMTLEAWVNPSVITNKWRDVIYKGNDNYFLEASTNTSSRPAAGVKLGATNTLAVGSSALTVNTWTHVAATYDGSTLRLYINGTQAASAVQTGTILTSTNPLEIGGDSILGQYFQGMIDEVRIYNVALTPTQIQTDMNSPAGGSFPVASLSATSLDFGSRPIGSTSPAQVVTLSNVGAAPMTISSIVVGGLNGGDFAQSNSCGAGLAPGASCTISVTFTPGALGARSGEITIADTAAGAPHRITLSGTGGSLSIAPRTSVLTPNLTQQFTTAGGTSGMTWSVDGVQGGGAASGTITGGGLYVPPATSGTHTVTVRTSDGLQTSSATVYVTNHPGVFTHHNDNFRTGQNLNESVLTPANVSSASFGKLASYTLDGNSHASPLYVAGVTIPGQGVHNVVYVATEHNSVYAFDADGLSTTPLWKVSFINPAGGVTTVPSSDTGECCDIAPEIGITGTPVIDRGTATLYVVAKTKEVSGGVTTYRQRLHALDLTTGAEKFGGPVVLQASVPGTGGGAQAGNVPFDALRENQRPALLLSNGVVYIGFGAHGDIQPYHGWLLGYDAATLQRVFVHNSSPNDNGAGMWQANGGPAADAAGNIYFVTGNGLFDVNTGGKNYGDSFVKISPSGSVMDYFTPYDQANISGNNFDLGAAGPLLLPDQPGLHPHLLVSAGKDNTIYLLDRDAMGHYNASNNNQIVQSLVNAFPFGRPEPGNFSSPVYFNGTVYFGPVADAIQAFTLTNGRLSTTATSASSVAYPYPGGTLAVSANGGTNGILWAIQRNGDCGVQVTCGSASPGVLRAYDAGNLAVQLYSSDQAGARDALDFAAKFSVPLVVNGKVFVTTVGRLTVYGLLP
jgi:hypothetical protein